MPGTPPPATLGPPGTPPPASVGPPGTPPPVIDGAPGTPPAWMAGDPGTPPPPPAGSLRGRRSSVPFFAARPPLVPFFFGITLLLSGCRSASPPRACAVPPAPSTNRHRGVTPQRRRGS